MRETKESFIVFACVSLGGGGDFRVNSTGEMGRVRRHNFCLQLLAHDKQLYLSASSVYKHTDMHK